MTHSLQDPEISAGTSVSWEACFSILDSASTVFQLKIKEALHIE